MRKGEPDFAVWEYITITKDSHTKLVIALGGTQEAAGILQRNGFLNTPGPRSEYHQLPHGLPAKEESHRATAASHTLLAAGYSVHLDPALNAFDPPDDDREAALRYLAQLSRRALDARSGGEVAAVLTELAEPDAGLLPLLREAVVGTCIGWSQLLKTAGADPEATAQLGDTAHALARAEDSILLARNHAARAAHRPAPATTPPSPAQPSTPMSRHR
ncbi:hypothetical protein [Streptomyces caeruleatus]|uniref:Uncharacterized protein n=1 Tax=Streptomyces caeruleatus TaxID=661399 RepID=A0A101U5S5_9ACTN|nr:hypothetical protein [Streptomyces caeruleatus]KUO04613.1 hypothetical protein AQJ67_10445 [Streptomyces caeruleatus]